MYKRSAQLGIPVSKRPNRAHSYPAPMQPIVVSGMQCKSGANVVDSLGLQDVHK